MSSPVRSGHIVYTFSLPVILPAWMSIGESEGSAGAHSPDLEVAGIFGLREAAWVLLPGRLPPLGWEVTMECFVRSLVVVALLEDIQLLLLLQSPVWIPERSTSKTPRNRGVFSGPSPARRKVSAAAD